MRNAKVTRSARRERGITLVELLIGIAITAVVAYVAMSLAGWGRQLSRQARVEGALSGMANALFTLGQRATSVTRIQDFRRESTFWRTTIDDQPALVSKLALETSSFVVPMDKEGPVTFRRDSNTLALARYEDLMSGTYKGAFLSRCVPEKDAMRVPTAKELSAMTSVPIVRGMGPGNRAIVRCCTINASGLTCGAEHDGSATTRIRAYQVTTKGVTVFPGVKDGGKSEAGQRKAAGEVQEVSGAGFFGYFDAATGPMTFSLLMFTIDNECHRVADTAILTRLEAESAKAADRGKCQNTSRVVLKQLQSPVIGEIHESGYIQIGK